MLLYTYLIYLLSWGIHTASSNENGADVRNFQFGYCRMTVVVVTRQRLIQSTRIRRSEMRTELCVTQSTQSVHYSSHSTETARLQQITDK